MSKSIESITQKACKAAYGVLEDEIGKLGKKGIENISMWDLEVHTLNKIDEWVVLSNLSSKASKSLYRSVRCGCHSLEEISSLRDEAWELHDRVIEHHHPILSYYGESLDQFEELLVEIGLRESLIQQK